MAGFAENMVITLEQWQAAGLSYHQYKWDKKAGKLQTEGRSCRTKEVRILIDTIEDQNKKQAILKKFPNPATEQKKNSFIEKIIIDEQAREYFKKINLPEDHQKAYVLNASIFNLIDQMYNECHAARAKLGGNMRNFWPQVTEVLKEIQNEVPHTIACKNHRVVQRNFDKYKDLSYPSLISGKFNKKNAVKITQEMEEWFVKEMCQNRLSAAITYFKFLEEAKKREWRTDITAEAFEVRMAKERNRTRIQLARWGKKEHRRTKGQTMSLRKAENSNDLWVGDGTSWNCYYNQDGKPAMATTYFVMDSLSRKFLGWSTAAGINKENMMMQLESYRMALRTAGTKPHQLKYDGQGGHKGTTAKNFYNKLSSVNFPSKPYRPSGKRIEPTFKDFQTVKLAEMPFWTGYGRDTHSDLDHAPNYDQIQQNIENIPTYEELLQLIDVMIAEWNDFNYNGKGSPNEIYEQMRRADEKPIQLDEMAELFWNIQGPKIYQPHGISLRYKGQDMLYEVYDQEGNVDYDFRINYLRQKFYMKYDPELEYPDIDLMIMHPTGGYQKVATASPKKDISESARSLKPGEKDWAMKQIKLEEDEYYGKLQTELAEIGYNEEEKWTRWRDKIDPAAKEPKQAVPALYGNEDDDEDLKPL